MGRGIRDDIGDMRRTIFPGMEFTGSVKIPPYGSTQKKFRVEKCYPRYAVVSHRTTTGDRYCNALMYEDLKNVMDGKATV